MTPSAFKKSLVAIAILAIAAFAAFMLALPPGTGVFEEVLLVPSEEVSRVRTDLQAPAPDLSAEDEERIRAELQKPPAKGGPSPEEIERIRVELRK